VLCLRSFAASGRCQRIMRDERDPSLCSGEAEWRHELFEQFNKLIAGEACALDDLQRQAAPRSRLCQGTTTRQPSRARRMTT